MRQPEGQGNEMRVVRRYRGITLIELMITLVVLVVLISLAAPAMTSLLETRRMAGASQAVYEQLQYARTEAIKQSRPIFVVVDSGTNGVGWCLGISDAPNCDCQLDDPEVADACTVIAAVDTNAADPEQRVVRRVHADLFPTITLTTQPTELSFNPVRGTATYQVDGTRVLGESVTLTSPRGLERTATINVVGRVTLN